MQTKVIETYGIEELEGHAREKALDWLREGLDYEWWACIYEDAKKCADILGIEINDIYFSGFWSQGDGACFNGKFAYNKGWKKELKAYAPIDKELLRIGQELQAIQRPFMYKTEGKVSCKDRYFRTYTGEATIDGRFADVPDHVLDDLSQAFTDFASWIYHNLEKQYGWLSSDECLIEDARANDWRFDESGRII